MKPSNDHEAITLILKGLVETGHSIYEVADDTYDLSYRLSADTVEQAVQLVCAVDDAFVFLQTPNREDGWVRFVLGNDPEEVAADYSTNLPVGGIVDPWWG